ncbi:hypothetical protein ACJW31_09G169700 [Castanea mollissima]
MEAVDWENSSGGSSDIEAYLQDTKYEDDEELHFTSGFISKLQFRKDKSRAHWINEIGMAEVVENKGKLWRTMGVVRSGKIYYSIEETLSHFQEFSDASQGLAASISNTGIPCEMYPFLP